MKKTFISIVALGMLASVGVAEAGSKKSNTSTDTGNVTGAAGISGQLGGGSAAYGAGASSDNNATAKSNNGNLSTKATSSTGSGSSAAAAGSGNALSGAISGSFGAGYANAKAKK